MVKKKIITYGLMYLVINIYGTFWTLIILLKVGTYYFSSIIYYKQKKNHGWPISFLSQNLQSIF